MERANDQDDFDKRAEVIRGELFYFLNKHPEKDAYITISAVTHALVDLVGGVPDRDNKKRIIDTLIFRLQLLLKEKTKTMH